MELPDHMIFLFLSFWGASVMSSTAAEPVCIPTSSWSYSISEREFWAYRPSVFSFTFLSILLIHFSTYLRCCRSSQSFFFFNDSVYTACHSLFPLLFHLLFLFCLRSLISHLGLLLPGFPFLIYRNSNLYFPIE